MFIGRHVLEMLREQFPVGTRVELIRMDDVQALPIGTKGTVQGEKDTVIYTIYSLKHCVLIVLIILPFRVNM